MGCQTLCGQLRVFLTVSLDVINIYLGLLSEINKYWSEKDVIVTFIVIDVETEILIS